MPQNKISSFRDLEVWCVSMDLVDLVLASTHEIPGREFDLRRQIHKATISVPSNIAEGYGRKMKRPAYQNHVSIALGSQGELETELEICRRNHFISGDTCQRILTMNDRVGAMLYRLHESLG